MDREVGSRRTDRIIEVRLVIRPGSFLKPRLGRTSPQKFVSSSQPSFPQAIAVQIVSTARKAADHVGSLFQAFFPKSLIFSTAAPSLGTKGIGFISVPARKMTDINALR
jgi:hypothetical protein